MPKSSPELAIFERLREVLGFYKYGDPAFTVRNLAQYCRVNERTVYNWLKGKTEPSQAKLRLIEEWLKTRPKPGELGES